MTATTNGPLKYVRWSFSCLNDDSYTDCCTMFKHYVQLRKPGAPTVAGVMVVGNSLNFLSRARALAFFSAAAFSTFCFLTEATQA